MKKLKSRLQKKEINDKRKAKNEERKKWVGVDISIQSY